MGQNLTTGLTGQLSQHQVLTQSLQHSLELLALPLPELEQRLRVEIARNPMLESGEFSEIPLSSLPQKSDTPPETEDENDFESNSVLAEQWHDDLPMPGSSGASRNDADYIGSLAAPPPQLRSELMTELHSMQLSEKEQALALEIVSALDDNGFLKTSLADIAMQNDADMDETAAALQLIQEIAPAGIGARDLPECLKLQLQRQNKWDEKFAALLSDGIDDLEKNRLDHLMKKLALSPEELKAMLKTLRSLDPAPGRKYNASSSVIIPDLVITTDSEGNFTVTVRQSNSTTVTISEQNKELLQDPSLSADDREILTGNLNQAKDLIKSLSMRQTTLQKLGELLVLKQRDFLENGKEFLHPLTMKDVAAILQVNESTVSRTVADKFAETPQGTIPLKSFFTAKVDKADGSEVSNQAVMEKIRQLIRNEDDTAPLSDDAIARKLKASGITLARRTVSKYREAMKIPPSSLRKKLL